MRDLDQKAEADFFHLFQDFFDSEKDAGKQHDPSNYSLDRMEPLAALAGHPEKDLKIVHVAGTKGKGSTCFFVSALLRSAGHSAGLFTSPHLDTVRERFQLDGQLVSYEELTSVSLPLLAAIRQAGLHPSLFEIFTVLALRLFADHHLEYAVMETGIGGRVDSTNYIESPACTAIAPVSFDHMALLGQTIEAIAAEKAGIIKPGVPLVLAAQPYPEAEDVIRRQAGKLQAPVIPPARDIPSGFLKLFPEFTPDFIQANFKTALAVLDTLALTPSPASFQYPLLRARCEIICREPLVITDGAHNGDSMEKLVQSLAAMFPGTAFTVVLGIVAGKDVRRIVQALGRLPGASFILTNPHTGKGTALQELTASARSNGLQIREIIPELNCRSQLPADTPLLFTGSFFTALIAEELFPNH